MGGMFMPGIPMPIGPPGPIMPGIVIPMAPIGDMPIMEDKEDAFP